MQGCGTVRQSEPSVPGRASTSVERRVVSLAPSLTEIAFAIGCQGVLVGGTTYDDYPPAARSLPHVADLVGVDLERLTALHPTAVVALHDQEHEGAPIQARLHIPVVYLPNRNLVDLYADISGVGAVCGRPAAAARLSHSLRQRIDAVARRANAGTKPRVFFLLDLPGFTVGEQSFIDDMIRLAGGVNVAGGIPQPYPVVSAEALVQMNPDVLIVAREVRLGPSVLASEPWRSLQAVRDGNVKRPPSDDIVERNGPRIVEGLAWLAGAIHGKSPGG
jgi:iron complex transport system substrate-binding protein